MPLRSSIIAASGAAALVLLGGAAAVLEYRGDLANLRARSETLTGGDIDRGKQAFARFGCGGCHSVRGVPQAQGKVGPPLDGVAGRAIIAGKLENEPANLRRWIEDPQAVMPGTAMPDLGVSPAEARDITAFLYTRT
jgi:cytochrome c